MRPIVSVILTSYNKPNFLKKAIDSVLSQTLQNFQLIIADDNSPNKNVWDVINSYNDSRIIIFVIKLLNIQCFIFIII